MKNNPEDVQLKKTILNYLYIKSTNLKKQQHDPSNRQFVFEVSPYQKILRYFEYKLDPTAHPLYVLVQFLIKCSHSSSMCQGVGSPLMH